VCGVRDALRAVPGVEEAMVNFAEHTAGDEQRAGRVW
jgi:hypothetical protein